MSYSYPDPGAVELSWAVAPTYTYPDPGAVVLRFAPDVPTADGFRSTAFGTPAAVFAQVLVAQGWAAGSMGAQHAVAPAAVGWCSTAFGVADSAVSDAMPAGAIHSTEFGTPQSTQVNPAATIGAVVRFGSPSRPHLVTVSPTGFSRTRYGAPIAYNLPTSAFPRVADATGFYATQFGAASVAHYVLSTAPSTQLGGASARATQQALGNIFGAMGTPSAGAAGTAAGFRQTALGTPTALRRMAANGFCTTRFGMPSARRDGAHLAYPTGPLVRSGHPKAQRRFNHPAAGFSGTSFGVPAGTQQYDALHIAPGARFGRPLRSRGSTC